MILGERVTSLSLVYIDLYKERKKNIIQEKGEAMNESAAKGGGGNARGRKGVARREEVEERKRRGG